MYSADGEYVSWFDSVKCYGPVENWFKNVGNMRERNRNVMATECLRF